MGMPSANIVTLDSLIKLCCSLGDLVESCYGLHSTSSILLQSTGEIIVTRNGMKILTESRCHHPFAKIITTAVAKHHRYTGDQSKLFLLLLKEVMIFTGEKSKLESNERRFRIELIKDIHSLLRILPKLYEELREEFSKISKQNMSSNWDMIRLIQQLSETYLETKFPISVSKQLSEVLTSFLSKCVRTWIEAQDVLNCLISDFEIFCSRSLGPVSQSNIYEGIILSKALGYQKQFSFDAVNFVFYLNSLEFSETSNEVSMQIEPHSTISDLVNLNYNIYSFVLENLKKQDILLVFMRCLAAEELIDLCGKFGIILIDCIDKEEADFLCSISHISPLQNWTETMEKNNIGHAKSVKTVSMNNRAHLQILLEAQAFYFHPHHLSLCGLTDIICREYYMECHNVLKVIRQLFVDISTQGSEVQMESKGTAKFILEMGNVCNCGSWEQLMGNLLLKYNTSITVQVLIAALGQLHKRKNWSQICSTKILLEPVASKELLVQNVLQLVILLLRIHETVFVNEI